MIDVVKMLRGAIGSQVELKVVNAKGRDLVVPLVREKDLLNRDGSATLVVPDVVLPPSASEEEFLKAAREVVAMKQGGPPRWTNKDGKSIEGEFLKLEGGTVVIRKDAKDFKVPLTNLSPASLAQARRLADSYRP